MAKEPRPLRHAAEYAAARTALFFLSLLPFRVAQWVGRRLGDAVRLVDRRHRLRAYEQAADRLGLEGAELDAFVKANFRNYGMTFAEFCQLARMTPEKYRRLVDMDDLAARIPELNSHGGGVIFITGHFGNWEYSNSATAILGMTGGSIARPLDNPRLNEMVRRVRERLGFPILDKQGAIRKAMGLLRKKGAVGILPDQDAGHGGLMSDFLGKPASTITIPAELAIRMRSPMIVVGVKRTAGEEKPLRFILSPQVHLPRPDADPETETRRLVDAINADLSAMIMQTPEQWMWIHRRWKSLGRV